MSQGWIKLYRKSIHSSVFKNSNVWMVWSWCLLKANHQEQSFPFNGGDIKISRGQFITGRKKALSELPLTSQKYRTAINYLKLTNRITIKSNNLFSLISIVKWENYQIDNQPDNQPATISISQQPVSNQQDNQPDNFQLTSQQPVSNQPVISLFSKKQPASNQPVSSQITSKITIYKNNKNNKNDKNFYYSVSRKNFAKRAYKNKEKEKKPYFWDNRMFWSIAERKWYVIEDKIKKEFVGKEKDIEWK